MGGDCHRHRNRNWRLPSDCYVHATEPFLASTAERTVTVLCMQGATERFLASVATSTLGETLPSLGDHSAEWLHQTLQVSGHADDHAIAK